MQYQFDRSFKFKINDDVWEAYLITEEESIDVDASMPGKEQEDGKAGEEFPALCSPSKRCFFVVEGNVNKKMIGHELFHLYVDYFSTGSADLDIDQFEEVVADFIGYNLEKFTKKRNMLFKKFKQLEESGRR